MPGKTLVAHARDHNLGIVERLDLIASVCEAVQHAHEQGIVHREVEALCFHPDGTRLFSGSRDRSIIVWDTESWRELTRLLGHSWWVLDLAISPDGETLLSASRDRSLRLWRSPRR